MNFEKLKYSKCPHCKKYGISASRGISRASTYTVSCKYCGKKFRVNSALAFLLTIAIVFIYYSIYALLNILSINIPVLIIGILAGISVLFSERYWPMEEEKDK